MNTDKKDLKIFKMVPRIHPCKMSSKKQGGEPYFADLVK